MVLTLLKIKWDSCRGWKSAVWSVVMNVKVFQPSYSSPLFQLFIEFLGIQSWERIYERCLNSIPFHFNFIQSKWNNWFLIIFAGSCDIDLWSSPVCHHGTCRTQLNHTSGAAPTHSRRGRSHDAFCYLHQIYHVQVRILRTSCGVVCGKLWLYRFRKVTDFGTNFFSLFWASAGSSNDQC